MIASAPTTLAAAALAGVLLLAGASLAQELPEGEGRAVVQGACTQCHGLDLVAARRLNEEGWKEVVGRMVGNGASLDDAQYEAVVKYLSKHLGPAGPASAAAPTAGAASPVTAEH